MISTLFHLNGINLFFKHKKIINYFLKLLLNFERRFRIKIFFFIIILYETNNILKKIIFKFERDQSLQCSYYIS